MASLLVVHDDVGPSADDTNLINFLTGVGHTVATALETSALPDVGYDAIIVTESGSSGSNAILSIPACLLPVMGFETSCNTARMSTAALTSTGSGTTYDLQGDPFGLNAGAPDPLTVFASATSYYGVAAATLPAGAQQLAIAPTLDHVTAWVADAGAVLTTGTAPNRRAWMGLITSRLSGMVAGTDSKVWFNGVVNWLAGAGSAPAPLPVGHKTRLHHPGRGGGPSNLGRFYKRTRDTTVAVATEVFADVDPAVLVLSGVDVAADGSGSASQACDVAALTLAGVEVAAGGTGAATVAVDPAVLVLSGVDVTAATGAVNVDVDPATLVLSGVDPAASGTGATSVTVDVATLTLTGQTPTAAGSGASSTTLDPAVLVLTGITPTAAGTGAATQALDVAVLVLSGVEVAAGAGTVFAAVDPAALVLTGITPAAAGTGAGGVTLDVAALTLVGLTPALAGSGAASVIADSATLLLSGVTPAAAGSGTVALAADSAVLTLEGVEVIAAGFVPDPNPIKVTARERPNFATVTEQATATSRALPSHATVTENATATVREASVGTIQENH